jgi:hypothetical protein
MGTDIERMIVGKVKSVGPPIYREQSDQYVRTLPWLALLSVVLAALMGGWLQTLILVVRTLVLSPVTALGFAGSLYFWLDFVPPVLWALSFYPLRERSLLGWRLFVVGTALSLVGSLLSLSIIGLLFSGAILYFTLKVYDEFAQKWRW